MQGMISQSDALTLMDSRDSLGDPIPFSFTRVTLDLTEKTGGLRKSYEGATLAGGQFGKKNSTRNANHFDNATRNVMIPGKPRPMTIQIDLITHINGERIYI